MNAENKDIILAEDDFDDLLLFEMAIQETGVPVKLRHAKNGELLFVLLKDNIPQLLFLDIHLPCKDGVCIKEIRRHREYDNLPVVMYSSSQYDKTIEECYLNGANFYLVKPNRFDELTEKLAKVFSFDIEDAIRHREMDDFVI